MRLDLAPAEPERSHGITSALYHDTTSRVADKLHLGISCRCTASQLLNTSIRGVLKGHSFTAAEHLDSGCFEGARLNRLLKTPFRDV